jgi:lipoprotein-releasing system permease protein
MNGFENELRERILGMTSHSTIRSLDGGLKDWRIAAKAAANHSEVIGVAPFIHFEGMFMRDRQVAPAQIRGILPSEEPNVSEVADKMVEGDINALKPGKYGVILGSALARTLGVYKGDKVTLLTPRVSVTPAGLLPRLKRFTVVGIFHVGMYEYDNGMGLIHSKDAATLLRMGDDMTGVRLKLTDMFDAPRITRELTKDLSGAYYITDWTRQHANFFKAIKTEKTVMFVILFLIVSVAAFNIVSTLVMLVTDKQADIAILRTLGATPGSIMSIFMIQGLVIGMVGILIGVITGVVTALNVETIVSNIENLIGFKFLPADVYYISDLPSDMHWGDVGLITIVAFILSLLATIYPAWRASRTKPAEALRYE